LNYLVMSNELATPKIVVCPADYRAPRSDFGTDFGSLNISGGGQNLSVSYFVGRDAVLASPGMLLAGDRNICTDTTLAMIPNDGFGISPNTFFLGGAVMGFPTNSADLVVSNHVGWSPLTMHQGFGNVALLDGSVQRFNSAGLVNAFLHSGDTSTRSGARNVLLFP
jgi:prepilin-type processing-associated H-X9-DG protein